MHLQHKASNLDKCDLKHYGDDAKPCDCTVQECDWKLTHNFFFNRYTGSYRSQEITIK